MSHSPISSRPAVVLAAAAMAMLVAATYFGYSPPYHYYLPMLAKARDIAAFPNDIFLANSVYLKASVFYSVIGWTGLKIEHDIVGLTLHVVVNAVLLAAAVAVVHRTMADGRLTLAMTSVLVSGFFYTKLVEGARGTPIIHVTPTPSGIGHAFGMAAMFAMLARRPALAAMLATACIAVAPKGNVLIAPILLLWIYFDRSLPRRALAWGFLPFFYIGFKIFETAGDMSPADAAFILDAAIRGEKGDGVFTDQPFLTNILLPAALLAQIPIARHFADPTARALAWATLVPTAVGWLLMLVYPLGLHERVPVPYLVMVSIPQATKFFGWLVLTQGTILILRSERLIAHEKILGIAALIALRPYPLHFALAAAFAMAAVASVWLRERRKWPFPKLPEAVTVDVVVPILLTLFVLFRLGITYPSPQWADPVAFRHSGSWSTMVFAAEEDWRAWKALAPLPDFPLFVVYENRARAHPVLHEFRSRNRWVSHPQSLIAAHKSSFQGLVIHGYGDANLWREAHRRQIVMEEVMRRLNAGQSIGGVHIGTVVSLKEKMPVTVDSEIVSFLSRRDMGVLVRQELDSLFPGDLPRRRFDGHVLIGFGRGPWL